MAPASSPLLEELQTIEENCLYTAQCHFGIAGRRGTIVKVVFITASSLAAIAGALVTAGLPSWLGVLSAVCGVVGAVTTALGANNDVLAHVVAANALTKLRHEARSLREAFSPGMKQDELTREVRRLSDVYNNMIQGLPPTDSKAMNRARQAIKAGTFEPDFRATPNGKAPPPPSSPSEQ